MQLDPPAPAADVTMHPTEGAPATAPEQAQAAGAGPAAAAPPRQVPPPSPVFLAQLRASARRTDPTRHYVPIFAGWFRCG